MNGLVVQLELTIKPSLANLSGAHYPFPRLRHESLFVMSYRPRSARLSEPQGRFRELQSILG